MDQTAGFRSVALILVVISTAMQGLALLGLIPVEDGMSSKFWFGSAEMLLILALLFNGMLIWGWSIHTRQPGLVKLVSLLCLVSLLFCAGGDFINRNYTGSYHAYGSSVRHTYLADSVWLFAPGYGLFLWATIRVARAANVSWGFMIVCALFAGALGAASFFRDLYTPEAGRYVSTMTGGYAVFIAIVGVSSVWLVKALGWTVAYPVAIGAVMATLADALIGNFWIYREGYYPAISHVNWILYFASQALVQQLPLQLVNLRATPRARRQPAGP